LRALGELTDAEAKIVSRAAEHGKSHQITERE
jgi:hypothetical protein